jgi:hypothetical protein
VSAADRPWWATDDGATGDTGQDPVEAHRAARRGQAPPADPGADAGAGADAGTDAGAGADTGADAGARADAGPGAGDAGGGADDGSWWVPATEAVTRLARDLRSAATERAGAGAPTGTAGAGGDHAADGEGAPGAGSGGGGVGSGHRIDACGVCPICVGLRAIGEARPDLVVHLAEAARQLALAVRTVVDVAVPDDEAAAGPGSEGGGDAGTGGRRGPRRAGGDDLQHIGLDD